jgi:hypothetical protein
VASDRVRIVLDLDPTADPVGGWIVGARGDVAPFSGWLALGRAIELKLAVAREPVPRTGEPSSPPTTVLGGVAADVKRPAGRSTNRESHHGGTADQIIEGRG